MMRSYLSIHSIVVCFAFALLASCAHKKRHLVVSNPASIARQDELIVIQRPDIEKHLGTISPGKFVIIEKDSLQLPVQYDDLNGDGNWDELAFLYSFRPSEEIRLKLVMADASARLNISNRTSLRSPGTDALQYLKEGIIMENDKCAFRFRSDVNTKDVIEKPSNRISGTFVQDTSLNILCTGNSLGAGSVAIAAKAKNGIDTLIRVGGPNIRRATYAILVNGPLRSVLKIAYDWQINDKPVHIIDETSIWGGQNFYQTKLIIEGAPKYAQAVAGFADFGDHVTGQINMAGSKIFYSYGGQTESNDSFGLAIGIDGRGYGWFSGISDSGSDIQKSYLVSQKFTPGEPVYYRFYSCSVKTDSLAKTEDIFREYLKRQSVLIHQPVLVSWHGDD